MKANLYYFSCSKIEVLENLVTATPVQDPDLQSIIKLVWSHDGKYLCALEEVWVFLFTYNNFQHTSLPLLPFSYWLRRRACPKRSQLPCLPRRIQCVEGSLMSKSSSSFLRNKPSSEPSYNDTEGLAREEEEEDMKEFNEALKERNRKIGVSLVRHATGTEFIFGLEDGQVFGIDNMGKERSLHKVSWWFWVLCNRRVQVESGILFIEFYEARSMVVLLTKDSLLYHLVLSSDGTCSQKLRVKLPGQSANYRLHINEFLLLICNCEK